MNDTTTDLVLLCLVLAFGACCFGLGFWFGAYYAARRRELDAISEANPWSDWP